MAYKWILKACIQKAISFLPLRNRINFLFQKYITRGVELSDAHFADRIIHARNHIRAYKKLSGNAVPEIVLELGSGWYPVVPLYFFLIGSSRIYSVDITKLSSKKNMLLTISKFMDSVENGDEFKDDGFLPDRINQLKSILDDPGNSETDLLERLGIRYKIADARNMDLEGESIDLIHSNNTFEHIPPIILESILKEFVRVLKPGGVMSHFIDLSDHFAHFDKSITIYNFLRFSEAAWKMIDNGIQPQNRLRVSDYRELYARLHIDYEITELREGNLDELKTVSLDPNYQSYSPEDLAVSHCQFISLKGF